MYESDECHHTLTLVVSMNRYGFLPLQGLEVPLMVLQSKVFLIVTLQQFSPSSFKRKTFIRKVKQHAVQMSPFRSTTRERTEETADAHGDDSFVVHGGGSDGSYFGDGDGRNQLHHSFSRDLEIGPSQSGEITQSDAMRLFTKIPFPEPKRVIRLRHRTMDGN